MKILVINSGSSSLKYKLYDMDAENVLASGLVERIGEAEGNVKHVAHPDTAHEDTLKLTEAIPNHEAAMRLAIGLMTHPENGVVADATEIAGVGHRVVHGGEAFSAPAIIDETVLAGIEANVPLAPLHNPANLTGIRVGQELFPTAEHVAIFDTAFHQTIPAKAYHYALPYELYEELKIRRYGFHGTSHKYVSRRAAELLGRDPEGFNCITAHLGNGSSVAAVRGGKCIDTSMGMTPLAGVIMGTRSGNIDPAIVAYLAEHKHMSLDEITELLTKKSGLVGICGASDMRDIHARIAQGDERAKLALEMSAHRIKQYVGAYFAELGRVDAIIFTAGIGENDPDVRRLVLEHMEPLGVVLDEKTNETRPGEWMRISTAESPVEVLVVRTDEELEIAEETADVLDTVKK